MASAWSFYLLPDKTLAIGSGTQIASTPAKSLHRRVSVRDAAHLVRLVLVLVVALVLFLVVRQAVVPPTFGQYGHFRGAVLEEIRARPVAFAGHATCESCHDTVLAEKKDGKHAKVACEACHGPQAKHADDPGSVKPELPKAATLCARCHEADSAKPSTFPQLVTKEHYGGASCTDCHNPHSPKM